MCTPIGVMYLENDTSRRQAILLYNYMFLIGMANHFWGATLRGSSTTDLLHIQASFSHLSLLIRDRLCLHLTSSFTAHRPARCPPEFTILSHIPQKNPVSNNHMHVFIYVPSYQRPHVQGQTRLGLVWWGYRR